MQNAVTCWQAAMMTVLICISSSSRLQLFCVITWQKYYVAVYTLALTRVEYHSNAPYLHQQLVKFPLVKRLRPDLRQRGVTLRL
jgi:hypothetical protein